MNRLSTTILSGSFFLLASIQGLASEVPVLLRLSRSEQADTNGCNFVEQVTALLYKEIIENRVKLWDSPSKEIQITGLTLMELEKSTGTRFVDQGIIYIYELWQSNRKLLSANTLGFNFSNKNQAGEDVAYGFVEYSSVRDLFMRTRINTNANGDYYASFATYVNNKTYNYNIIQFSGKVIRDVAESNKIKRDFIGNLRFNEATFQFSDPDKLIIYQVETNTSIKDARTENGNKLINAVENYLTENQEVFYNLGGDRILSYYQKNKLKVTRLEITEIWKKTRDTIITEARNLQIFVNDSALNPMPAKDIARLDISVGDVSIQDFIRFKKYAIIICQINAQKIPRTEAFLYYKALVNMDWKRLTEYVKDF